MVGQTLPYEPKTARAVALRAVRPLSVRRSIEEAHLGNVTLNEATLEYPVRKSLERLAVNCQENPADLEPLERLDRTVGVALTLPFEINLRKIQNVYYEMLQEVYPKFICLFETDGDHARRWVLEFRKLGEKLRVALPELSTEASEELQCVQ